MLIYSLLYSFIARTYYFYFFFFNDTATTEIYTLSLHDALPICEEHVSRVYGPRAVLRNGGGMQRRWAITAVAATRAEDGRAHLLNPLTTTSPIPAFSLKKKKNELRQL